MKFPPFQHAVRTLEREGKLYVFDIIRNNYFVLTPEEWVRQHVLHELIHHQGIANNRIAVERQVKGTTKRFDILIHSTATGLPQCIIECKSYNEKVGQNTLNQIGRYNLKLNVPYLVVTNWQNWIAAEIKKGEQRFTFLDSFPDLNS